MQPEWPVLAVLAGVITAPAVEQPRVQVKKVLLATDFRESAIAASFSISLRSLPDALNETQRGGRAGPVLDDGHAQDLRIAQCV